MIRWTKQRQKKYNRVQQTVDNRPMGILRNYVAHAYKYNWHHDRRHDVNVTAKWWTTGCKIYEKVSEWFTSGIGQNEGEYLATFQQSTEQ